MKQTAEHIAKRLATRLATLAAKPLPVAPEWLREQYIDRRRDCVQIGAELGKDPKTIWEWLRRCSIPTRSRGHDTSKLQRGRAPGFTLTQKHKDALRTARLKDGRRPYLMPDGSHAMRGRTGADHPGWKGGLTPERQAFYASEEWRKACASVWARANATCERCGVHHNTAASRGTFHVHHRVSFMVRELRATLSNLVLLCAGCHRFVHSRKNINRDFIGEKNARS